MNIFIPIASALLLLTGIQHAWTQQISTNDRIMERIRQEAVETSASVDVDQLADKNLKSLQPNGSWKDINYADKTIAKWQPGKHLERLQQLVRAYINPRSTYYGSAEVFHSISNSFGFWYQQDPQSSNWWHNEIATPQDLGRLLILMRFGKNPLDKKLESGLIDRMKRGNVKEKTGANKSDIALHYFYRGLLTDDEELIQLSVDELFYPVQLVYKEEGLQHDFAYLQHGPQLQISSYGAVFITGVLKLADYVRGTPYAMSPDKLKLFSQYYRDSYLRGIRGAYMDFNLEGRGVSRLDILNKDKEINQLEVAMRIDSVHSEEYESAIERTTGAKDPSYQIKAVNKHFWTGDYTQHIRPAYSFNVRTVSTRTKRSEAGNGENLLGRYLSDGATNIQVNGPEYYNIMPVWEWDKIPGVTSRDYQIDRPIIKQWGEDGHNEFAGGVSDGTYGASAYYLDYDSVNAHKSWFFFDDEIVCLGAGIKSATAESISTTLNQSWFIAGSLSKGNNWVIHDGIGYYIPENGKTKLSTTRQTGNWYDVNNSFAKDEVGGEVFKMWIDHGIEPTAADYAYFVLPGVRDKSEIDKVQKKGIKIVVNTASAQAVYHHTLGIYQAVLYEAGQVVFPDMRLKVDKPCLVMVRRIGGKEVISIADPTHKEQVIRVEVEQKRDKKPRLYSVTMPQAELAGATVRIPLTEE